MSNRQEKYKTNVLKDRNMCRLLRAGLREEQRRENRATNFARMRDIHATPQGQNSEAERKIRDELEQWKREKESKKKLEQKKKRPVFKVGIVHHRYYSPTANDRINNTAAACHSRCTYKVKAQPSPPKRITRATQKRLEAKAASAVTNFKTPTKTPKKPKEMKTKTPAASFAPKNYEFKCPTGIKTLPLFGSPSIVRDSTLLEKNEPPIEIPWPTVEMQSHNSEMEKIFDNSTNATIASDKKLSSPRNTADNDTAKRETKSEFVTPENDNRMKSNNTKLPIPFIYSPFVTVSRGKENARRERRSKIGLEGASSSAEIPTKETIMKSLNISAEEEERTAQYYKFILQKEVDRLSELCKKWEEIKNEPELPEETGYIINQAIGQTNLLMGKKFQRFRGLVNDCETGKGEMLVTCRDLQGFWDLIDMEIIDCDSRFDKLDKLRAKNWIDDEIVAPAKRAGGKAKKGGGAKLKVAGNVKSTARSWILARKKEMAVKKEVSDDDVANGAGTNDETIKKSTTRKATKGETTNRRSETKDTPSRVASRTASVNSSLKILPIKSPLKKNSISSPLAVMKVAKMCKSVHIQLDDTISYVNSDQTPTKSILKKSDEIETSSKENKNPQMKIPKIILPQSLDVNNIENEYFEITKKRRSTRKSVRFNAEDCTACTNSSQPVHPMTPHTRRSRKISLLGGENDTKYSIAPLPNGDLMLFDSPAVKATPPRVRRTIGTRRNPIAS